MPGNAFESQRILVFSFAETVVEVCCFFNHKTSKTSMTFASAGWTSDKKSSTFWVGRIPNIRILQ